MSGATDKEAKVAYLQEQIRGELSDDVGDVGDRKRHGVVVIGHLEVDLHTGDPRIRDVGAILSRVY